MRGIIAACFAVAMLAFGAASAQAQEANLERCMRIAIQGWTRDVVPLQSALGITIGEVSASALGDLRSGSVCPSDPARARVTINGQTYWIALSDMRATRDTTASDGVSPGPRGVSIDPPPSFGRGGETAAPSRPPTAARETPDRSATRGVGRRARTLTPALVELLGDQARTPRQGGSAVVLLARPGARAQAQRNELLCQTMFQVFDQATPSEIAVGVRTDPDGGTQLLRPIYWPVVANSQNAPGAGGCAQRLANFDFPRGQRLRNKFRLTNAGPYIAIERYEPNQTETLVAVIDFTDARPNEIPSVVNDFRDGFSQRNDIWNPNLYTPDPNRSLVASIFGGSTSRSVLPRLTQVTQHIACPLANLLDVCRN
ncbi:MAG: hypothetical protein GC189_06865 [Alphaproteobacteria bacterium]|nr:hypothetical protein [Alphaproteobacteria bacterium]